MPLAILTIRKELHGFLFLCIRVAPFSIIGHLQDPVTWYGINYTGTQMTQWDFQNKGTSGWTGTSSFVLRVPLRYLRHSVIYSVPCDWILQMAYHGAPLGVRAAGAPL